MGVNSKSLPSSPNDSFNPCPLPSNGCRSLLRLEMPRRRSRLLLKLILHKKEDRSPGRDEGELDRTPLMLQATYKQGE